MNGKLTIGQNKFAQEYVLTGNASEAYRRAYPRSLKWKEEIVHQKASRMLKNGKVKARVRDLQAEVKERFDISAERLLLEQSRIALFDFRKLFSEDGRLVDPLAMSDDVSAAVSSVKVNRVHRDDGVEETVVELKLWNKNTAIDSLMKHKGLYEQDNDQKRPVVIVKDFSGGE